MPHPLTAPLTRGPAHAEQRFTCRVERIVQATPDIRILWLQPEGGKRFAFSAGQYARVSFGGREERDYSLAGRPSEPLLEFHIRNMRGGPSLYVNTHLQEGATAEVRGPFGTTYLRGESSAPILAVGGGSGLAPMKSIVEEALAQGMSQPIHLYFGARAEGDVYLEEHFAALTARYPNFRFIPVLSAPSGRTQRRTGLVTDAIAADFTELSGFSAYLAGPPPMVEAARTVLPRLGLESGAIHADPFIGEAERYRREGPK